MLAGLRGNFDPEILGYKATFCFLIVCLEILVLKLGCYLLSISNDSQLLDLVAYSGYKFVGAIVTLVVSEIFNKGQGTGGWIGWTVFSYAFLANAFFLVRNSSPYRYLLNTRLTPSTATIPKICAITRKLWRRERNNARCSTRTKDPEDTIPILLLIPSPVLLYVVVDTGVRTVTGGMIKHWDGVRVDMILIL